MADMKKSLSQKSLRIAGYLPLLPILANKNYSEDYKPDSPKEVSGVWMISKEVECAGN